MNPRPTIARRMFSRRISLGLFEPLVLHLLAAKRLHQQRAAHREGLVHARVQIRQLLLRLRQQIALHIPHPPRREQENRDERHRKQRQPPIEEQHQPERRRHDDQIPNDPRERLAYRVLHRPDVVRHPGKHFARAVRREPAQRHPRQVPVEPPPEVEHDRLANHIGQVTLQHPEHRADAHQGNHQQDQGIQGFAIAPTRRRGQCIIDDPLEQVGRSEPDQRRRNDDADQQRDRPGVGAVQRDDAPEGWPGRPLRLLALKPRLFGALDTVRVSFWS